MRQDRCCPRSAIELWEEHTQLEYRDRSVRTARAREVRRRHQTVQFAGNVQAQERTALKSLFLALARRPTVPSNRAESEGTREWSRPARQRWESQARKGVW